MSRSITSALEDHFKQDVTSLAMCFDIERRDGTVLGFTNHDKPIEYDGVTYDPFSSAAMFNLEQLMTTEADNMEMSIAFDDKYITKEEIQRGEYDHAFMRIFFINHQDPDQGILKLTSGYLGTAEIKEYGAKAEMMSLANALQTEIGCKYSYKCRATWADEECGFNEDDFKVTGTVDTASDKKTFTDPDRDEAENYFKYGVVKFTSGDNEGWTREVKAFKDGQFDLLFAFPFDIAEDDEYEALPGCSNYPEDCKNKFGENNIANYRGEPFLPGRDEVGKYPDRK